jgi:succinoglycan biosynthesis protein ExoM
LNSSENLVAGETGRANTVAGRVAVPKSAASLRPEHICVCVCTYKRLELLQRLLQKLTEQKTDGLFTFSVVVVDNDAEESARSVAGQFASALEIAYLVESRRNIALARNRAVENADGDYLAFIDDDEFPINEWLLLLYKTCTERGVDGVLGPVKRHFDVQPPQWILKSRFYDRRVNATGTVVEWPEARTGNVLLKKHVLTPGEKAFRPEFRAGEDQDFFRRMIEKGHVFIWSAEAVAYETVPPARWNRGYMLRKALLRGATARLQPTCGPLDIAKSFLAVFLYAPALPFSILLGQHRFMTLLVKMFDHLGKLLAVFGINPIKEEYITD